MFIYSTSVLPKSASYSLSFAKKHLVIKLHEVDVFFENERYIYIIDTVLVKNKHELLKNSLNKLNEVTHHSFRHLLNDNYFVVLIDKTKESISLFRDVSGIKTGYYSFKDTSLVVGTNVNDVAKQASVIKFNDNAVYQLLYSGYLLDGFTIYEGVNEVKIGRHLNFTFDNYFNEVDVQKLDFAHKDNLLDLAANVSELRQEIVKAHQKFLSEENIILLSGGLDSVTMLVALDDITDKKNIVCNAFKVKDTDQDETVYAQAAADFLAIENRIVEVDPSNETTYDEFEKKILQMNNPYDGVWIFGNFEGSLDKMFFAGQDTRLHTPALSLEDKWAFVLASYNKNLLFRYVVKPVAKFFKGLCNFLGFDVSTNRNLRGIAKFFSIFDINSYIRKYHLKHSERKAQKIGLNTENYELYLSNFNLNFENFQSKRDLYNQIVAVRWQQQYISDIRYMQDLARINNTYIAMPFYDASLAEFSSGIPYDIATKIFVGQAEHSSKKTLINKYILREAVRDKIPDLIYYRHKGGSQTCHLMYNGVLGKKVRSVLFEDMESESSVIKKYKLYDFVNAFLNQKKWELNSEDITLTAHYICSLCIYNKLILNKNISNNE